MRVIEPLRRIASMGCGLLVCAAASSATLSGVVLRPSSADLSRAVALARWPHSDDDRLRFHTRYTFPTDAPVLNQWTVEQIEVVTELRRAELLAEEHARINDSWGRAGTDEVEAALRPWRGQVSIIVHLALRPSLGHVRVVPPITVALDDLTPLASKQTNLYPSCPH